MENLSPKVFSMSTENSDSVRVIRMMIGPYYYFRHELD